MIKLNKKEKNLALKSALSSKLSEDKIIFLESLEIKNHKTKEVLIEQITNSVPKEANDANLIIAYEPIWAIGTGLTPTLEEIDEIHSFIKKGISGFNNYKVLYGGSVKSSNCKEILSLENVDGVLVGNASLDIKEFNKIIAS